MGELLQLGLTEFVVVFGNVTFIMKSNKTQVEVAAELCQKIALGQPFTVDMNGALMIINPCPGMNMIIMTKEQFERNRNVARLTGQA